MAAREGVNVLSSAVAGRSSTTLPTSERDRLIKRVLRAKIDSLRREFKKFQKPISANAIDLLSDGEVRNYVCHVRIRANTINVVKSTVTSSMIPRQRIYSFAEEDDDDESGDETKEVTTATLTNETHVMMQLILQQ